MDLKINGKTALVSGSTAGIGLAIATVLAQEGADTIVNGRTQKRVDDAVAQIKKIAPSAKLRGIAADLGTAAGAKTMADQLPAVDILVNNMGIFEAKPFAEIPDEEWMKMFETNVMSGVRLSRSYLPGMLKKNWGRIVFISSESALNIPKEMIHYGMSKTAQVAVARGLAEMTTGTNVTVNSVLAGPTRSEGVEEFIRQIGKQKAISEAEVEKEFFKSMRPTSLIKRFETTEEIAQVVAFVVSAQAAAINGAAVRAEGGCVTTAF